MILLLSSCVNMDDLNISESDEQASLFVSEVTTETVTKEINDMNIALEPKSVEYSIETQEYMNLLMSNQTFMLIDNEYEYAQVIDLNNDNTPEVIIECNPYTTYEQHYCYVFSKDDTGVFVVPHSDYSDFGGACTYYGGLVTVYCDGNDNNVFICNFLYGGMNTGYFGKKNICFDGKLIYERNLYTSELKNGVQQYRFLDGEFTLEKECKDYDNYMESLKESNAYSQYSELFDRDHLPLGENDIYVVIADLLNGFYNDMSPS